MKPKILNTPENMELRRKAQEWLVIVGHKQFITTTKPDNTLYGEFFKFYEIKPPKGRGARTGIVDIFLENNGLSKSSFIESIILYYKRNGMTIMNIQHSGINNMKPESDYHRLVLSNTPAKTFYQTPEWKALRYQAIRELGNRCMCCGSAPDDGVKINVDHIKPRSIYPEFALNKENLQILCDQCNSAKSNTDKTDWR